MAAIVGFIGLDARRRLEAMADRLSHGGPSKALDTVAENIAVGAVGLHPENSIFTTNRWVACAMGNIYNSDLLVAELRKAAVDLTGSNIGELLTLVHEHMGLPGLASVDGHFAAAIYDRQNKCTYLLRDFFSQRPLFWTAVCGDAVAFASEVKAFLAMDDFDAVADREMLQLIQGTKRLAMGRTCLKNVFAVKPGITVVSNGREESYQKYAPLETTIRITDEETARAAVLKALQNSVRKRFGSYKRIGIALSGGIDSICLAFFLREAFPDREIHTFTAGRDDKDQEIITAGKVAAQAKTVHHPIYTPPHLLETELDRLIWYIEAPQFRSEALPLLLVGDEARSLVDVMITGQGADNLFAGMPKHKLLALVKRYSLLRRPLWEIYNLTQVGIQPTSLLGRFLAYMLYRGRVPAVPRVIGGGNPLVANALPAGGPTFINRVLAAALPSGVYEASTKFGRTLGGETVDYLSPFADMDVVRTALSIDEKLKIKNGIQKYIFRKAIAAIVPPEFTAIPKHPQSMQYDLEFAEVLDRVTDSVLEDEAVASRGFFDPVEIRKLRRTDRSVPYHPEGAMRLWTAILTEHWARVFLDARGRPTCSTVRSTASS